MKSKLHIAVVVLAGLIGVLSAAAGVPKVVQMPQELEFLASIGMGPAVVSILGALQILGGALMFWGKTRIAGSVLVVIGFLVSSVAIFAGGNSTFGLISLVPVLITLVVVAGLLLHRSPN